MFITLVADNLFFEDPIHFAAVKQARQLVMRCKTAEFLRHFPVFDGISNRTLQQRCCEFLFYEIIRRTRFHCTVIRLHASHAGK